MVYVPCTLCREDATLEHARALFVRRLSVSRLYGQDVCLWTRGVVASACMCVHVSEAVCA